VRFSRESKYKIGEVMGKWLARVIGKEKPQEKSYQNPSKNDTDKTDKISHLNLFDPKIKNQPRLDLLTEVELEAFNGWYATARKPKFGMSHEEATQKAWELLIESMKIMCAEGRGRFYEP
jgi:hypothetical protein